MGRDAIEDARGSVPMSPLPDRPAIPPRRQPTGSMAAAPGESTEDRALRVALDARTTAIATAATLGAPPDALNPEGEGALGVLFRRLDEADAARAADSARLDAKIDAVGASVGALTRELKADREAAEAREKTRADEAAKMAAATAEKRAPWSRIGWIVLTAALGLITVGSLTAAGAYLASHLQWRTSAAHP